VYDFFKTTIKVPVLLKNRIIKRILVINGERARKIQVNTIFGYMIESLLLRQKQKAS